MTEERDAGPQYSADDGRPPGLDEPPRETDAGRLRTIVVKYADRPDECTVCPADLSAGELLSAWITTTADALVDLDEVR